MADRDVSVSAHDKALQIIDALGEDLTNSLPSTIDVRRFKAAFINLAVHNPNTFTCTTDSLRSSLVKCAHDGLIPDGRLAAIVPFRNRAKVNGQDRWVNVAVYMPMVQGLISRARELGETFSVTANVVHQADVFLIDEADPENTTHKRPPLNQERGAPVGAYVIFRDKERRVIHREVMDLKALMKVKAVSKAKEGNTPWNQWPEEMMRKTVIRRGSKYIPMSAELRTIIERDDELVDLDQNDLDEVPTDYNPLKGKVIDHQPKQASPQPEKPTAPAATPASVEGAGEGHGAPAAASPVPSDAGGGGPSTTDDDDSANPPAPAQGELLPDKPLPQEAPKPKLELHVNPEVGLRPTPAPAKKPDLATRDRWVALLTGYSDGLAALVTVQDVQRFSNNYWKDLGGFPDEGTKAGSYAENIFRAHLTRAQGKGSPADADQLVKKIQSEVTW